MGYYPSKPKLLPSCATSFQLRYSTLWVSLAQLAKPIMLLFSIGRAYVPFFANKKLLSFFYRRSLIAFYRSTQAYKKLF
jgi:hypothetical protein